MKISSLCLVLLVFQHSILFPCPEESIEEETPPAFEDYEVDPFLPVGANQANSTSLIPEDFSNSPFNLLIFGGGYLPSGNQFSLESNVKYFIRVRSALGLHQAQTSLYFADGNAPDRDLQFFDPDFRIPL